jgi:hypothetical protein
MKITIDGTIDVYNMKRVGGSATLSQFSLIGAWSKLYKRVIGIHSSLKFKPLEME